MPRKMFICLVLPLLLFLSNSSGNFAAPAAGNGPEGETGTLEKMIVANGHVAMDLDLNRLSGIDSKAKESKLDTLRFHVGTDSFFTILVFDDILRGPEPGSTGLVPENTATLPGLLQESLNQLAIEKLAAGEPFDLVVRDRKTGLVFFTLKVINMSMLLRDARSVSMDGF